jgi:hypothetical protein
MKERLQINLTLFHIAIGSLMAFYSPLSKIYMLLIPLIGFYIVVKSKNKNNEILYVIAYIAGSEVFFRTTNVNTFYEAGKYLMLFFTFLGFFYDGFPKVKNPYWVYLLLLLPAVFVSFMYLNGDFRRKISFEILGPICMGFLALYNYKRKISAKEINAILTLIALPILACCVFLILKYSQHAYNVSSNRSNFYFSGEFAPNQMATVLGLGVFIYLLKIITESDNKKMFYPNIIVFCLIFYRGLLTFSRGGIATGVIVILVLLLSIYISRVGYFKVKRKIGLLLFVLTSIFILTAYQTENSLFKRYSNFEILDSGNIIKTRGRYIQIESDIKNFRENPLLGIGVGKGKEVRNSEYNRNVSTHSEITRLLSEHGVLGLCALLILLFYPLRLYFNDLRNFYLLPFLIFWLLTINHSATRIIAPLFLYTLTLLQIKMDKKEMQSVL